MSNPFSLKGKTILVTGASSGLGVSIAKEITNSGGNVIITGRNQERLNNTFNQLLGDDNISFIADLCNVDDIDEVVKNIPNIDGIVFCAGIIKTLPIKNINDDAIEEIFHTNIISSIQISNRLLKAKKLNKSSSIVFISSVSTFNVKIGNSLYSATKGAVNSFARAMALEVSKQDMRVNCIQPGFIPTGMLVPGTITQEQINEYIAKHPLGLGRPTDVSYACVYFLSDASRWVTGSVITIDGGLTLRWWMGAKANNVIPIDTVHIRVHDLEDLERDLIIGRNLGFEGMLVLNPKEIPLVHQYYSPSEDEVAWATEMLQLSEEAVALGKGVAVKDNKFIGPPMVKMANNILKKHQLATK